MRNYSFFLLTHEVETGKVIHVDICIIEAKNIKEARKVADNVTPSGIYDGCYHTHGEVAKV